MPIGDMLPGDPLKLCIQPPLDVVLESGATMPAYAHNDPEFGDMCCDLFALEDTTFMPGEIKLVRTGVHVAFPPGWGAKLHDRSGMSKNLHVRAGVIDAGYTGEICVRMERNYTWADSLKMWALEQVTHLGIHLPDRQEEMKFTIKAGDKFAQMEVKPFFQARLRETTELPDRTRGAAGFGSTGQ
jgi:dUTP pyrophosphatase